MKISRRTALTGLAGAAGAILASPAKVGPALKSRRWVFDNLAQVDGEALHVEGNPQLIDSPFGKAMLFDGVKDGVFIDRHPLAGAATFAFEAYFRPDGGAFEQKWFYLGEPVYPTYAQELHKAPRFTFEIRVVGDQWYLDAFTFGPTYTAGLMFPDRLHPCGKWYHVAQTYDGETYRSFVNGTLQGQTPLKYQPQAEGQSAVGTRMSREAYFKGAIHSARFTPHFLASGDFLPMPA
jgi:hypothetical protein